MSYVLQGGTFTRTFTSVELETLSLKLIGSQQSYFKTDGIAVILLSELGYLLLMGGSRSIAQTGTSGSGFVPQSVPPSRAPIS